MLSMRQNDSPKKSLATHVRARTVSWSVAGSTDCRGPTSCSKFFFLDSCSDESDGSLSRLSGYYGGSIDHKVVELKDGTW
jgi:hypothetical protein